MSSEDFSMWLHKDNNFGRQEGKFCFLQDRNIGLNYINICDIVNNRKKTFDFMTSVEKM